MKDLLLDTNIVSILFKPDHPLYDKCLGIAGGSQWFISFMTRAELLLWPRLNHWGAARRHDPCGKTALTSYGRTTTTAWWRR